ncbi:amidohydrolase family protein [Brumicola nitratireducens]|uniref:Amidohydrolase n=1 Tax=Glaciecola nitratireducens (strain JCM 12485 / KCTC 12276 / FR1064) TaxID=1085623 RepID=G4QN07_GLANF|nr:amidohydrolase family protein [Glaciecola nitratireducens]AEP31426.1 amidohydrolase [Glaciecola nitratireducens FR1064]
MQIKITIVLVLLYSVSLNLLADTVIINNVNIVSTTEARILQHRHVLLQDGLIKKISKTPIIASAAAKLIDAKDRYLIPGLIDSHVHLAKVPGMNRRQQKMHPQLVESYIDQQPRSYLYFGYTTLIDLNVFSPSLINRFKQTPLHPDVFTCGQHLDIANGHGMFEEPVETRLVDNPNFLYDHHQKQIIPDNFDLTKHTPAATVAALKADNAICVKTYYENGYGGSEVADYDIPSYQIIREVVSEAKKRNLPVVLHANSWESYRFALLANVDILGHGLWHWGEYRHDTEVPTAIQATLQEIAKRQIGYQPTMHVIASQRALFDPKYLNNPLLVNAYPSELLSWYKTEEGGWFKEYIKKYLPSHMQNYDHETLYKLFDGFLTHTGKALEVMSQHEGNLLLGTDTIIGQSYANAPGYSGFEEMQAWYKFGVPLDKILKAATIGNAKAFNLDKQYGTVEEGKKANLLLLRSNPLATLSAYNEIDIVFLAGTAIQRETLSAQEQ